MKKHFAAVLAILLIAGLTGCGRRNGAGKGQDYFCGTVLAVYESSVLVECTDSGSGAVSAGSEASVSMDVVAADGAPELTMGDAVKVVFSGVQESDPLGFDTVFAIYLLDEDGEVLA